MNYVNQKKYSIKNRDFFTQEAFSYNLRNNMFPPLLFNDCDLCDLDKIEKTKEKFGWLCELMRNEIKKLESRKISFGEGEKEMLGNSFKVLLDLHDTLYSDLEDKKDKKIKI